MPYVHNCTYTPKNLHRSLDLYKDCFIKFLTYINTEFVVLHFPYFFLWGYGMGDLAVESCGELFRSVW